MALSGIFPLGPFRRTAELRNGKQVTISFVFGKSFTQEPTHRFGFVPATPSAPDQRAKFRAANFSGDQFTIRVAATAVTVILRFVVDGNFVHSLHLPGQRANLLGHFDASPPPAKVAALFLEHSRANRNDGRGNIPAAIRRQSPLAHCRGISGCDAEFN